MMLALIKKNDKYFIRQVYDSNEDKTMEISFLLVLEMFAEPPITKWTRNPTLPNLSSS